MGSLGSSLHVKTIGRSLPPLSSTHELHSKTCTCSISIRMLNSSASVSLSSHTLRQLKFVIPGALITYYLGTHHVFWDMVNGIGWDGWARYTEFLSIISPFRITPRSQNSSNSLLRPRMSHRYSISLCPPRPMDTRHRAQCMYTPTIYLTGKTDGISSACHYSTYPGVNQVFLTKLFLS